LPCPKHFCREIVKKLSYKFQYSLFYLELCECQTKIAAGAAFANSMTVKNIEQRDSKNN